MYLKFKIMKTFYEQKISGWEVLTVFITPLVSIIILMSNWFVWFLSWLNKWAFNCLTKLKTITTWQPLRYLQAKKSGMISWMCRLDSHNMKITYSENACDLEFVKSSCGQFCMFDSMWLELLSFVRTHVSEQMFDQSGENTWVVFV